VGNEDACEILVVLERTSKKRRWAWKKKGEAPKTPLGRRKDPREVNHNDLEGQVLSVDPEKKKSGLSQGEKGTGGISEASRHGSFTEEAKNPREKAQDEVALISDPATNLVRQYARRKLLHDIENEDKGGEGETERLKEPGRRTERFFRLRNKA